MESGPPNTSLRHARLAARSAGKYLTFSLGNELFGIPIGKVQEIIGRMPITPVPHMPPAVLGVINLRGQVIPVVSQRVAFGRTDKEASDRDCIVIVQIECEGEEEPLTIGSLVDTVADVLDVEAADIQPPPRIGTALSVEFLHGMAKSKGKVVALLNMDRVYSQNTRLYASAVVAEGASLLPQEASKA